MRTSSSAVRACRLFGVSLLIFIAAPPARAALTGGAKLAAVYHAILSAQFDRSEAALNRAFPMAPAEACHVLGVMTLWWRIQIDPTTRSRDRLLNDRTNAPI